MTRYYFMFDGYMERAEAITEREAATFLEGQEVTQRNKRYCVKKPGDDLKEGDILIAYRVKKPEDLARLKEFEAAVMKALKGK